MDDKFSWQSKQIKRYFRVVGITAKEINKTIQIFVAYDYWHDENKAKSFRVSRLVLQNLQKFIDSNGRVSANQWELLYESKPLIPFSDKIGTKMEVPFNNPHNTQNIKKIVNKHTLWIESFEIEEKSCKDDDKR